MLKEGLEYHSCFNQFFTSMTCSRQKCRLCQNVRIVKICSLWNKSVGRAAKVRWLNCHIFNRSKGGSGECQNKWRFHFLKQCYEHCAPWLRVYSPLFSSLSDKCPGICSAVLRLHLKRLTTENLFQPSFKHLTGRRIFVAE